MYSFLVASFAAFAPFSSQVNANCGSGCQASLKKPHCVYVTYGNSAYTERFNCGSQQPNYKKSVIA
eukprot:Awhi_evm2s12935